MSICRCPKWGNLPLENLYLPSIHGPHWKAASHPLLISLEKSAGVFRVQLDTLRLPAETFRSFGVYNPGLYVYVYVCIYEYEHEYEYVYAYAYAYVCACVYIIYMLYRYVHVYIHIPAYCLILRPISISYSCIYVHICKYCGWKKSCTTLDG